MRRATLFTREDRLKLALELTRLVWDLKHNDAHVGKTDLILDVFETCYQKMERLDAEVLGQPVVPAD